MAGLGTVLWRAPEGFSSSTTALEVVRKLCPERVSGGKGGDLDELNILLTGTTSGIGSELARAAIELSPTRIFLCNRNRELAEKQKAQLEEINSGTEVILLDIDLERRETISNATRADEFLSSGGPLHLVFLNAGICARFEASKCYGRWDGEGEDWLRDRPIDRSFAVCHLGHQLLFQQVRVNVEAAGAAWLAKEHSKIDRAIAPRVILTSSGSHRAVPKDVQAHVPPVPIADFHSSPYGVSKHCNVVFAGELNRQLRPNGVLVASHHPATMVASNILSGVGGSFLSKFYSVVSKPFVRTLEQAAATAFVAALHPDGDAAVTPDSQAAKQEEELGGGAWNDDIVFLDKCTITEPDPQTVDPAWGAELWRRTEVMLTLPNPQIDVDAEG
jgi:WW domain-containing oxidoreductase